jgi:hypothetical protein
MRRGFWQEAFGQASGQAPLSLGDSADQEGGVLPEGFIEVSFPGSNLPSTMARGPKNHAADLYWMTHAVLAWLNGVFSRNPFVGSVGLEHVWLRAAPSRGSQDWAAHGVLHDEPRLKARSGEPWSPLCCAQR